ncbi:MAG: hypothetical protein AAGU74_15240 [Bacillota bacterium]
MTSENTAGRPKVEWGDKEWKIFEELCNIQCTMQEICRVLGVTDKTLTRLVKEKYGTSFSAAYRKFAEGGKASLRRYQFNLAQKNATMAIWLGKQYLGQRDIQEVITDGKVEFCFDEGYSG